MNTIRHARRRGSKSDRRRALELHVARQQRLLLSDASCNEEGE
jgi:hypothetical protein